MIATVVAVVIAVISKCLIERKRPALALPAQVMCFVVCQWGARWECAWWYKDDGW